MKSTLIDLDTDIDIYPKENKELVALPKNKSSSTVIRREFLLYSLLGINSLVMLNNKVEANPLLVIGALIAGSIIRGIARVIGRTVSRKIIGLEKKRGQYPFLKIYNKINY